MNVAAILLLLVALAATRTNGAGVVELASAGTNFDELPYADWLSAGNNRINISIEVGTLIARNDNGSVLMRVDAPVYRNLDDDSETIAPFGPLLRIKRGGWYTANVLDNLEPQPGGNKSTSAEAGITNFHVHGLHVSTGVPSTDTATTYLGGDNIFIMLEKGDSNLYRATVPNDHLPGIHWYHPHFEPATLIQTFASHGPILVEDDDAWLPDANGCSAVRGVVNAADRKIMLFTRYPFTDYSPGQTDVSKVWNNNPNYQFAAKQANVTYCCDEPGENDDRPVEDQLGTISGTAISANGTTGQDLVFLNGGYQPTLSMAAGVWQRWSMVMASYNGALVMSVKDPATGEATDACEVLKLSSDGVWAMEIPRPVSYMVVPSGGRGEVLIRCDTAGTYELWTSSNGTQAGNLENQVGDDVPYQKLVTLDVGEGGEGPSDDLTANECTPLRPYYAPDMRDPALKAAGAKAKYDPVPDFTGTPPSIGCSMSGERFSMTQDPYLLAVGQVTEWRFARLALHPLHVHINPFQLMRLPEGPKVANNTSTEGGWYEPGDFYDTLYIPQMAFAPPGNGTEPYRLPIRFNPGPYFGESVTHCHFLNHEDSGCMHMIKYTCPDGTVQEDYPYRCSTTTALKGTFEGGPGSTDPSTPELKVDCTSIMEEGECLARHCDWDGSVCAGPAEPPAASQVTAMMSASAAMLASLCLLAV